MASYARKQYFIKKRLQTRFIWTILLIILLVFVIIACNLFFFSLYLKNEIEPEQVSAANEIIKVIKTSLLDKIIMLGVVNIFIIVIISLFFSHQIAGPIYKIEITLKKIRAGNLAQKFFFRKTDNLDELADELNETVEFLTAPLFKTEETLEKLENIVDSKEGKLLIDELKNEIASMQTVVEEIKEEETILVDESEKVEEKS
jgi:methyl-accepting chemotaxis protein